MFSVKSIHSLVKRLLIPALSLLITCFAACKQVKENKSRLMFYTYASGKINKDSMLTPASFIYLDKNGTYTLDFARFDFGRWSKQNGQLLLKNSRKEIKELYLKHETEKALQIEIGDMLANFELQPANFEVAGNNPFALENNKWRIPATQKETDLQLKNRLNNHFKFWELYFMWALDNEFSTVDVRSTPTPVKIYGNGFGLKAYKELPSAWKACFYDSLDCQHASSIIREVFDHQNIAWAHSDNKYKMFISAFQQLQGYID